VYFFKNYNGKMILKTIKNHNGNTTETTTENAGNAFLKVAPDCYENKKGVF
jgi:hypothetical protein